MTVSDLQGQWESASANQLEFSLLSLTRDMDVSDFHKRETKIQRMREDWGPFIASMVNLHAEKGDIGHMLAE